MGPGGTDGGKRTPGEEGRVMRATPAPPPSSFGQGGGPARVTSLTPARPACVRGGERSIRGQLIGRVQISGWGWSGLGRRFSGLNGRVSLVADD